MSRKKKKPIPVQMPKADSKQTLLFTVDDDLRLLMDKRAAREIDPIRVKIRGGFHGGNDQQNNRRDRKLSKQEGRGYLNEYNKKNKSSQFDDSGSFLSIKLLEQIVRNLPQKFVESA